MSAKLRIEITVPAEHESAVVKDLERRGGSVHRSDTARVIKGDIPADAIADYGAELRNLTAGFGTHRAYVSPERQ